MSFSCFDKTGTLTEDFMDFETVVPSDKGVFGDRIKNRLNKKYDI